MILIMTGAMTGMSWIPPTGTLGLCRLAKALIRCQCTFLFTMEVSRRCQEVIKLI
ncbi:unnamed protein product [Brassica rapa subsp. trilocularis]